MKAYTSSCVGGRFWAFALGPVVFGLLLWLLLRDGVHHSPSMTDQHSKNSLLRLFLSLLQTWICGSERQSRFLTYENQRRESWWQLFLCSHSWLLDHVALNSGDFGDYNEASSSLTQKFGGDNTAAFSERVEAHLHHSATDGKDAEQPHSNERNEHQDKVSEESPIHLKK
jgi:hypothetical protein